MGAPIGVALIGYGSMAEQHVTAARAAGATLEVVYGPDTNRAGSFARTHDIPAVARSLGAALGHPRVEAAIIASPSSAHAEQASAALEAGRHALVEIPLALSASDGERLAATAEQGGLILGACHTLRFWTPYALLMRRLAAATSSVKHVVARRLLERRGDRDSSGQRRSWTDDLLWHHGGHSIDMVLAALGSPPVEVAATSGPTSVEWSRPMDHSIAIRAASGALASIALSYHSRLAVSDLMVITADETWHLADAELRSSRGTDFSDSVEATQARAVAAQDSAFLAACRGGPAFPASAAAILPTLRIQQAIADGRLEP